MARKGKFIEADLGLSRGWEPGGDCDCIRE